MNQYDRLFFAKPEIPRSVEINECACNISRSNSVFVIGYMLSAFS